MSAPVDVREPWLLTREEWNAERERVRPEVAQSNFTRASGSEAVARNERLNWLLFGVRDDDREALRKGGLTDIERVEIFERIQTRVTYDDVIARAERLGLRPALAKFGEG